MAESYKSNQNNILYGKKLADEMLDKIHDQVTQLKKANIIPTLTTIEIGSDPASRVYMESQRRIAKRVGINYEALVLPESTTQSQLIEIIENINQNPDIHGLMVHVPLPQHIAPQAVQWSIDSNKDVEGVSPHNLCRLCLNEEGIKPCTAESILSLIKYTGIDIKGKEATVVGYSDIVGKPSAMLLLKEEATVNICHYATSKRGMLEHHVRNAEILVVAVGKPDLIKGEWIKEGAIVIDAGINEVENGIVGDVEFEKAQERAAFITPIPGGVGRVTVAFLMQNTLNALQMQMNYQKQETWQAHPHNKAEDYLQEPYHL